jgi:hypothetical protein
MKKLFLYFIILIFLCSPFYVNAQQGSEPPKAALNFVQNWLKLLDNGQYADSWHDMAAIFKQKVTQNQWVQDLKSSRAPLGKISGRGRLSVTRSSDPEVGEYVVFQFESTFENKKAAREAVSVVKGDDGSWGVLGYSIF